MHRLLRSPAGTTSLRLAAGGSLLSAALIQLALVVASVAVARQVGVTGRGHFALMTAIPVVIAFSASGGLLNAITYHVSRQPRAARGLLRASARSGLGLMALLTAGHAVTIWILYRDAPASTVLAAVATLPVVPAWLLCQGGAAALQGSHLFTGQSVARAMPYVFYGIASLALWTLDVRELGLFTGGWAVSYAIASIAITWYVARRLPETDPSIPGMKTGALWRFGLRDTVGAASPVDTLKADQLVVGILMSPALLGLYAAASALVNVARLIGQAIGAIAYPIAARDPDGGRLDRNPQLLSLAGVAVGLSLVATIAGIALAPFLIPAIYGAEFAEAVPVAQILLAGSVFLSLRRLIGDLARGSSRPGAASIAEIIGWATFVAGLLVLAPPFGLAGVALAVVAYWAAACVVLGWVVGRSAGRTAQPDRNWQTEA